MARTVKFHQTGGPEVLRIEQTSPGEPKPGEVRIRVGAIGLNRVEAMYRSGEMGPPPLPSMIGYEAAGVIDAVGAGVTTCKIGDRVSTLPGLPMADYGTYADIIFYPATMLLPIPDGVSMQQAAAAWMQYLTAYALIGVAKIQRNEKVIITAASSSVGLAAIQIANAVGAVPIAVTRSKSKEASLRRHGARYVIATESQELSSTVAALTEGYGPQVIFDAIAGDTLGTLVSLAAPGATIIIYGALAGAVAPLPVHLFMLKSLIVRGYAMNDFIADPVKRQQAINYIDDGLRSGQLTPVIDRTFDFDDIVAAHRHLESNQQIGKIVVNV